MTTLIDDLEREKAHSDQMTALAAHWMRQAQDAELALAVVVFAAGGVTVHSGDLEDAMSLELTKEYLPHNRTYRFSARPLDKITVP